MRSEPLPLADLAPDAAATRGRRGNLDRRDRLAGRARLRREPARDRRRADHRRHGALLLRRAAVLLDQPDQHPGRTALLDPELAAQRGPPARHGPERIRRARPDHVRRPGLARGGLRGGSARHDRRRALRCDLRLLRRLGRRTHDAHRRRAAVGAAPLPRDRARGDLPAVARRSSSWSSASPHGWCRPAWSAARRCRCACASTCSPSASWAGATSASCCATSSPTRSARSSSTPRSRSPMRSCCSRRSGSSASASRRRRRTGDRCSPTASTPRSTATGGRSTRPALRSCSSSCAFNFVGDALRDAFEVRLQRR